MSSVVRRTAPSRNGVQRAPCATNYSAENLPDWRLELLKEGEQARADPAPTFIATYTQADILAHRRCIYVLLDPRKPSKVMYVGMTVGHPITRLERHLNAVEGGDRRWPCQKWIGSLLDRGVTPSMAVLQTVRPDQDIAMVEQGWIRFYKHRGEAELNREVVRAQLYGLTRKAKPSR